MPTSLASVYVINGGTAAITLPSAACNYLYLGEPNGANAGTIQISGGGLSASYEYVGYSGTGTFTQSGGTNNASSSAYTGLYLGYSGNSSSGNYNLFGPSLLSAYAEYIGNVGAGTFYESGGANMVGNGGLTLGYANTSSSGKYILSGSGLLSAPNENVGDSGPGTFAQSGGTNNIGSNGTLYLATGYVAPTGSYDLGGSGRLSAYDECVGYSGTGTFTQSGGTNDVSSTNAAIYLGGSLGGSPISSGNYNLSGSGFLAAYNEYVGYVGTGSFMQSGGTNKVGSTLSLGGFIAFWHLQPQQLRSTLRIHRVCGLFERRHVHPIGRDKHGYKRVLAWC